MTPTRWLWAIVLIAAALRLFPVWFGLPYRYARPDEAVSISRAVGVLAGHFNPQFFNWPSLTFYLFAAVLGPVSAVRSLFGVEPLPLGAAVIAARVVVALAGTLTVIPLFRLAVRMGGERAGVLAAAFLAVAPLHVRDSHFAVTDVLMTLLLTMSLASLVAAHDRAAATGPRTALRQFAIAGVLGGLATSTKYNAAMVLASMGVVQVLLWMRPVGPQLKYASRSVMPSLVFGAALAAGFVAGTPFAVIDAPAFVRDFRYELTHLSGGHAVPMGRGWTAHAARSLPYGCGALVVAAALIGAWTAARHYRRHALIVGAFAVAYYMVIGSGFTVFFRYVMPLVPVVCLFAALGTDRAGEWTAARRRTRPAMVAAGLGFLIAAPSALTSLRMDLLLARTDTRVIAARWLGPQLRAEHTLHDAGNDYTRLDMRDRHYHEWRFDPATQSFGHPAGLTPDWLVIGDSPLRHYANADPGLRRLARDRYDLVYSVRGTTTNETSAVYDQQDAFFVPFSGFSEVERPGPNITIYRRRR